MGAAGLRADGRAAYPSKALRLIVPFAPGGIESSGSKIIANTPEQFAAQIAAEYEVYKKVVAQQKLKLD